MVLGGEPFQPSSAQGNDATSERIVNVIFVDELAVMLFASSALSPRIAFDALVAFLLDVLLPLGLVINWRKGSTELLLQFRVAALAKNNSACANRTSLVCRRGSSSFPSVLDDTTERVNTYEQI